MLHKTNQLILNNYTQSRLFASLIDFQLIKKRPHFMTPEFSSRYLHSQLLILVLRQINPVHIFQSGFLEIHFNILVFKLSPCSKCNFVPFWVISRRLISNCRRFGTHYRFHLHRQMNEVCQWQDCATSPLQPYQV